MGAPTDPRPDELRAELRRLAGALGVQAPECRDLGEMTAALAALRQRAESLRRSEERFRLVLGHAPVILATCDRELRYTWIFNPHPDFFDQPLLGRRDDELDSNPSIRALAELKRGVLESGRERRERIRFALPSGDVTYEISAAPLRDEGGAVTGVRTVALEVTERVRAEDRLRQLSRVLEDVEDPIHIEDRRGILLEVNSRLAEVYGWRREELIGQSVETLIAEEDRARARELRRRCLAGESVRNAELTRCTRDGRSEPILLTLSPWRDERDRVAGFVGIAKDISAQKQRIEDARAEIRAILDTAVDAIVTLGPDGAVESLNPAAERMFGYRPEELRGRRFSEHLAPPSRRELERLLTEADLAVEGERELLGQRRDGRSFPMEVSIGEHSVSERRLTLILRDVTRRKQLESEARQAQKMEAVGRLASGVAHDFNNLLMGITGAATVALAKLEPGHPARLFLEELKASAAGGAGITRQLLAFSRQGPIEPRPLDLDEFLERTAPLVRRLLGEDVSVQLRRNTAGRYALLDEGQLQQMLLNLAVNARDAMPNGGTLMVESRPERVGRGAAHGSLAPGDYVVLSLTDTGCGMDEETRERIFEPFFTTKPPGQGTGLGLSTAYAVVTSAGGHIDVESRTGGGTRFEIWFPEVEGTEAPAGPEPIPPAARGGGSETILVVEDEDLVRRSLRDMLQTAGYRVVEAADGPEAIDAFRAGGVDLVFTDVVLPSVSGQRVAETIRQTAPDVPVIFISAHSKDHLTRAGRLPPEERFLQKPFSPDLLFQTLRTALAPRSDRSPEAN